MNTVTNYSHLLERRFTEAGRAAGGGGGGDHEEIGSSKVRGEAWVWRISNTIGDTLRCIFLSVLAEMTLSPPGDSSSLPEGVALIGDGSSSSATSSFHRLALLESCERHSERVTPSTFEKVLYNGPTMALMNPWSGGESQQSGGGTGRADQLELGLCDGVLAIESIGNRHS
jgi:hypothetical protein